MFMGKSNLEKAIDNSIETAQYFSVAAYGTPSQRVEELKFSFSLPTTRIPPASQEFALAARSSPPSASGSHRVL